MYRRLLFSAYQTRNRAHCANVFARKCNMKDATVVRHVLGGLHKGFGTSSTCFCENKDEVFPPKTHNKTDAKNDADLKVDVKSNGYLEKEIMFQEHSQAQTDPNIKKNINEVLQEIEIKEEDGSTPQANEIDLKVDVKSNGYLEKEIMLQEHSQAQTDQNIKKNINEVLQEIEIKEEDGSTPQANEIVLEEGKVIEEIVDVQPIAEQLINVAELKTDEFTLSHIQQEEAVNVMSKVLLMEETRISSEQLEAVEVKEIGSSTQTEVRSVVEKVDCMVEAKVELDLVEGQAVGIKTQRDSKPERKDTVKSGKESLLDLLGAMKVEVTSKRKFVPLKVHLTSEPAAKPQPAAMESTISMFQQATAEAPAQSEMLSPELVAAASAAASTLPNKSQAESELLRQLRHHESISENQKKGDLINIGDVIADMKVGKKGNGRQHMRPADQIRFDEDGQGYTHDRGITAELGAERRKKSLFLGKRLGIFSPPTDKDMPDTATAGPTLWDFDLAEQLAHSVNQLSRNGFEEMIQLTKEGKLWQYPIDNEAGMEEEASVPFHEHVFLEKHIEGVFPRQGPVRHFMELVVAGLAKNPFLTVKQKKEHIAWFGDYFQQKQQVLKEADVYLN